MVVHITQIVLKNYSAKSPAQLRVRHLIGSKMYPAVNARVRDIVGNPLKWEVYCKMMLGTAGFVNVIECPTSP